MIANELLDNLLMALAQGRGGWRERWVGVDEDRLAMVDAQPRRRGQLRPAQTPARCLRAGWVEVQLAAGACCETSSTAAEARLASDLRLREHRREPDSSPTGRDTPHPSGPSSRPHPSTSRDFLDITADVNFTALMTVASEAGVSFGFDIGRTTSSSDWVSGSVSSALRHAELAAARSGEEMERLRLRTFATLKRRSCTCVGDFRALVARK